MVLVRARSLEQLRATAASEAPSLVHEDEIWQRVAHLLEQPRPRALVVIEPAFVRHLLVLIPRVGRPRVRRVDDHGLLNTVLAWHREQVPVELMAMHGCDPTLLSRASQLVKLSLQPGEEVGYERNGRVLILSSGRARSLPLEQALRRPRALTWVPQDAELGRSLRRPLATGLPTIQVVGFPLGDHEAALFSLDVKGTLFRERVPRALLEVTLQEYREVLHRADPATLLSATVHPLLTSLAGRRTEGSSPVQLTVELGPHGERVLFEGERFGMGAALPWSALAEAVLSHWPPGTWAHVGVKQVQAPASTAALTLLAARSRVLRRLAIHLGRISAQLQAA
jgi:hypothetical protein